MRWAGHSHVCRETGEGTISLTEWKTRLRERGLNYFGFGHPWERWDLDTIRFWELDEFRARNYHENELWRTMDPSDWLRPERFPEWKKQLSDPDFLFGVDLETPKIRFGHLWWIGWTPEAVAPWHDYDKPWTAWETSVERDRGEGPPPFRRRFPAEVIRVQHAAGAVPVYAHPTSWWLDANGRHITNIASTLVPDLLTGQACGALVVMGYEATHRSYQELWFDLLDRGFFLTGVAETDACLDFPEPFPRALFHNIANTRGFSEEALQEAVRAGRNVMTTGPDLSISCGDVIQGGVVSARGGELRIAAADLDPGATYRLDCITTGGRIVFSTEQSGVSRFDLTYLHEGGAWVLARLINTHQQHDAALTNPIFFGCEPVRVTAQKPPSALVPWWKNPESRDMLDYLTLGTWRRDFPSCQPGELPATAFQWENWKSLLQNKS